MDKELIFILQILLNSTLITTQELQEETNSSKRQITYRLDKINDMLKSKKVQPISFVANKEVVVNKETKEIIREILDKNCSINSYYFSKNERMLYMYLMLFINIKYLSVNNFTDSMKVSRSTISLDFKELIPGLEREGIYIKNSKIDGYFLTGSENDIRRIMIKSIIETLASGDGFRVLDFFIKEYKLESFEYSKEVISKLVKKHNIKFVEDRLVEFIYIFIFLRARIISNESSNKQELKIPNISVISSAKEYNFTKELIEVYGESDEINLSDIMYISAWILGMSVGNIDEDTSDRVVVSEIVDKILTKFESISGIHYRNHKKIFRQLYSHFRPAYYRLLFKLPIVNPLCEKVKEEYSLVYKIVSKVMKEFFWLFREEIQEEEIAYLTLHFAAILQNKKEYEVIEKKKALVVCSNGVGSSVILYAELTNLFPELHFYLPIEASRFSEFKEQVDIIFVTSYNIVNLEGDVPIIKVSPVMTEREKYKIARQVYIELGDVFLRQPRVEEVMEIIKKHTKLISEDILANELMSYFTQIENLNNKGDEQPVLSEITNENLISLNVQANNWEEAIRNSASSLLKNGYITENYVEDMIRSAKEYGPYIVITKHVALPHARPESGAKEIAISISTLNKPIEFGNDGNDPVKYVFCLSAIDNNTHLRAMSELVELLEQDGFYEVLDNAKTAKEIMDYIIDNETK